MNYEEYEQEVTIMRLTDSMYGKNLKKQLRKLCAAVGVAALLTVSAGGTDAAAASSVRGKLNGFGYYGSISKDNTSATAVTTFGRGGSVIIAKAWVYYWFGDKYYNTYASDSATVGGAKAVAKKKIGGADVVGGKGQHSVSYDKYKWGTETTTTGEIPSKSTEK